MNETRKWLLASAATGVAALALAVTVLSPRVAMAHGGGFGGPGMGSPDDLAKALGITTTDLQAAQAKAETAAVDEAVTKGLLTKEQADAIKSRSAGTNGLRRGRGGMHFGFGGEQIDREALLAKALGITVDKLQAAEKTAFEAGLKAAQDAGRITAEQADQLRAGRALRDYLKKQGLDEKLRATRDQAVKDAVAAGVITQAQADALKTGPGMGFGFKGGHGFGFRGERGGFGGRLLPAPAPASPDASGGANGGTSFRWYRGTTRTGTNL